MKTITLECCNCGKTESGDVPRLPEYGFELMRIAELAGWNSAMVGAKVNLYCSAKCLKSKKQPVRHLRSLR